VQPGKELFANQCSSKTPSLGRSRLWTRSAGSPSCSSRCGFRGALGERFRWALYLLDRRFRRGRGYSWQIGTQTGSLDGIETTALSTELRQAGRGGTYTEFIVELRFRQPLEAVKIEGFRTEGDARELIALLSRTLHVPFIDRTVEPTRQVDWNDVAKPLVDRASKSIGAFRQSRRYLLRLQPAGLNFHVPRFSRSSHSHVAIPRRSSAVARFCLDFRMDWIRDPW
jgi:hypothetical protein